MKRKKEKLKLLFPGKLKSFIGMMIRFFGGMKVVLPNGLITENYLIWEYWQKMLMTDINAGLKPLPICCIGGLYRMKPT